MNRLWVVVQFPRPQHVASPPLRSPSPRWDAGYNNISAHAQEESRGSSCGIEHDEPHFLPCSHEHRCDHGRCVRRTGHAARDGHRRYQGELPSCFGHGLAAIPPDNGRAFQAAITMMASGAHIALRAAIHRACCAVPRAMLCSGFLLEHSNSFHWVTKCPRRGNSRAS